MTEDNQSRNTVLETRSNVLGTHFVPDDPIAILGRDASEFVHDLSAATGMNDNWTLNFIVATYRKAFGFNPPPAEVLPMTDPQA